MITLFQHISSRLLGKLADCKINFLKNFLIRLACRVYKINLSEAISSNLNDYKSFNDFFTRQLKSNARIIIKSLIALFLLQMAGFSKQVG